MNAYFISGVQKDVRLVLSGEPDPQIAKEIARLGLEDYVAFKDLSTDGTLAEVYRGAVAFLFPSLYEGFGLPPLEAMACGVPVLTSNVCSLPEVVGDAAVLVHPQDVEEIADGIKRLVQDSLLRDQLQERSLLRARVFSWGETARKTLLTLQFAIPSPQALEKHD